MSLLHDKGQAYFEAQTCVSPILKSTAYCTYLLDDRQLQFPLAKMLTMD